MINLKKVLIQLKIKRNQNKQIHNLQLKIKLILKNIFKTINQKNKILKLLIIINSLIKI